MSKPELTKWFVNGEKPARKGVYERKAGWVGCFSYWGGKYWCLGGNSIAEAFDADARKPSSRQNAPWRGLANPPKAKP